VPPDKREGEGKRTDVILKSKAFSGNCKGGTDADRGNGAIKPGKKSSGFFSVTKMGGRRDVVLSIGPNRERVSGSGVVCVVWQVPDMRDGGGGGGKAQEEILNQPKGDDGLDSKLPVYQNSLKRQNGQQ